MIGSKTSCERCAFVKFIMKTRSSAPVTCLTFGAQRKAVWPEYFCCHSCDLFEDAIMIGNRRANFKQIKSQCAAAHDNAGHPTTARSGYRPNTRNSPALTSKESLDTKLDAEGKNNAPIDKKPTS